MALRSKQVKMDEHTRSVLQVLAKRMPIPNESELIRDMIHAQAKREGVTRIETELHASGR